MKFILLVFSFITLQCQAQKQDTVDHFFPWLIHNQDIVGNYTWNRPLYRNDTVRYKVIVEDTSIHVTVKNDSLGIIYKLAYIMDTYSLWIDADSSFGPHWEMYDLKGRRIRELPIFILKIDELPRLEPYKKPRR